MMAQRLVSSPRRLPEPPPTDLWSAEAPVAPQATEAPPPLIRIPLLAEGADPDSVSAPEGEPQETLRLDPRILPSPENLVRPFAYRLADRGAHAARPALREADLVIVTRSAWPTHPDAIYAVRLGDRIVLTRVLWKDATLWRVPAAGDGDLERMEPSGTPPAALVGRVAAVVRENP